MPDGTLSDVVLSEEYLSSYLGPPRTQVGSVRRRRFLSAMLATPALLLAPPFISDLPFQETPGLLDRTGLLSVPRPVRDRTPAWIADMRAEWNLFHRQFVTSEGRVVDTHNSGVSHTEGQGVALLFAAEAGDLENFERILEWTNSNLRKRRDSLYAWRWRPNSLTPVTDLNNATDGDILIAWSLMRAAERFGKPHFESLARAIASDILDVCTRQIGQRLVLLPGAHGFEQRNHVVLNPSYYIFPALLEFERLVPGPKWRHLVMNGLEIGCRQGCFGRWSLPADWIEVPHDPGEPVRLAADKPSRFSWDGVRVPLYLAWGRRRGEQVLHACHQYWTDRSHGGRLPAWTDLRTDRLAPYAGHAGVAAVASLTAASVSDQRARPQLPRVADATDYYGASLTLLARMAWHDAQAGVVA